MADKTPAAEMVASRSNSVQLLLPSYLQSDRDQYALMAISAANDYTLAECHPMSVLRAIWGAAKLGLSLDKSLGQAYLIPRKTKKGGKQASLQIGYLGWCELAYRSKSIAALHAEVVFTEDEFDETLGSKRELIHKRWDVIGKNDSGDMRLAYCTWMDVRSNTVEFHRVGYDRIQRAQQASESFDSGYSPWKTDPIAMWKKVAITDCHRFWKLTPELALAGRIEDQAERGESQDLPKDDSNGQDVEPEVSALSAYNDEPKQSPESGKE